MKFERAVMINAPLRTVWQFLWDVDRVVSCVPHCESVRTLEPQKHYEATVADRVGPFSVKFDVDIIVTEMEELQHLRVKGSGKDKRLGSSLTGTADLWLVHGTDGDTEVRIVSDVNILGKLGSLGHSVIVRKADEYMNQITELVKRQLESATLGAE